MKSLQHLILLIICASALMGCGKKARVDGSQMSIQYVLGPFEDINNPSTLNLEALESLPQTVNLKIDMTPAKDQGERGSCSYFAAAGLVESAIKHKMNVNVNISEEYFNYMMKSKGYYANTEGGYPAQNLITAIGRKEGFLLEKDWAYQPTWFSQKAPCLDFSSIDLNAPTVCFTQNAPDQSILNRKILADNFETSYFKTTTTNEIIERLANNRVPLSVVVPVNNRGWNNSGEAQYDEEMRQECIDQTSDCGTHAIILTGYDLKKKVFFFKNSWGDKWGEDGFGEIPFAVIDLHTEQEFSSVVLRQNISLPPGYSGVLPHLENFDVDLEQDADQSVKIRLLGSAEEVGHHALKVTAVLVKGRALQIPNESNTHVVELSNEERAELQTFYVTSEKLIFQEQEVYSLDWQSDEVVLNFSSALMSSQTVQEIKSSPKNILYVKASVFVYTDSGVKLLKNEYFPL